MAKNQYKGAKTYETGGNAVTPYNSLLKEYDDYIGEIRKDKNRYGTLLVACLVIIIGLLGAVFYAVSLPKAIPMVIEVAPWGEAKSIGAVGKAAYNAITISDQSKLYYIRKMIEGLRNIPTDRDVFVKSLGASYKLMTTEAAAVANGIITKEGIYKLFGAIRREVKMETILNVTGAAWQADWTETDYDISSGNEKAIRRMRAVVTVKQGEPDTSINSENPLGFFISSYQQQEIGM